MLRALLARLGGVSPWFLKRASSTTQSLPPTVNLVGNAAYISGGDLIEKVNGVWQASGQSFAHAAVSADGLTVAGITGFNQVSVYRRASLAVSFVGSAQVLLNMPVSATDGSIPAALSRITLSADGNRIVATSMKAVPGRQYVCTALWNGSSWVLSTFNNENPDNYTQDLHVSLSPGGDRLIQIRSDGRVFSYKYSGFPTIPWEDVGNVGFLSTSATSSVWLSETAWAVMDNTTLKIYTRPVADNQLSLTSTYTKTDLGVPSASVLKLLAFANGSYIMAMDLYTLAEFAPELRARWRLDVAASGNVPVLAASPDGRLVLLYNGTGGTNYPNSTLLFER